EERRQPDEERDDDEDGQRPRELEALLVGLLGLGLDLADSGVCVVAHLDPPFQPSANSWKKSASARIAFSHSSTTTRSLGPCSLAKLSIDPKTKIDASGTPSLIAFTSGIAPPVAISTVSMLQASLIAATIASPARTLDLARKPSPVEPGSSSSGTPNGRWASRWRMTAA